MCIRIVISVAGLRDRLIQNVSNIYITFFDGCRDILRYSSIGPTSKGTLNPSNRKKYRHAVLSCKITEHDDPERLSE
jgi:hypothetical protein